MCKKKKAQEKAAPPLSTTPNRVRTSVDDAVNDVHDDELYEEESGLRKESHGSSSPAEDVFERPW